VQRHRESDVFEFRNVTTLTGTSFQKDEYLKAWRRVLRDMRRSTIGQKQKLHALRVSNIFAHPMEPLIQLSFSQTAAHPSQAV